MRGHKSRQQEWICDPGWASYENLFPVHSDHSRDGPVIKARPIRFLFFTSVLFGTSGKYSQILSGSMKEKETVF